jgi:hypothetical protein
MVLSQHAIDNGPHISFLVACGHDNAHREAIDWSSGVLICAVAIVLAASNGTGKR